MLRTFLAAFVLGVLLAQIAAAKHPARHVSQMIQAHFIRHGVRLPSHAFTKALREAAIDISHLNCHSSTLVIVAMANEEALKLTVPLFLRSLKRVKVSGGKNAGETFDARLVVVAWSLDSLKMCIDLQRNFSHQCVRDAQHFPGKESFGFHSDGFHALGFAKVKYILNSLSAGHDVLFLDADVQLLRDPVPYIYQRDGDMFVMMEKCLVYNVSRPITFRRSEPDVWIPPLNIGSLYFKATAGVTRCVYNWIWDMYGQVPNRAHVWDQVGMSGGMSGVTSSQAVVG
ncbi:hypothetical protein VOLCADRAFT_89227 [Volvox carteri f. nagariensis]|uniref:Nucleotide-diphospho-sugar transferase domain-containing protein n=1 Tax=Volvox carteri f. nagariensis TaxID=3068 RepID=D8TR52_VOLCA|nr:uncharacterized protein VOLCADRAFT_89227 [Volvox carteri f. nagariensis]EFJ50276.1 hypothetical protein VOLCADRAFT_89227 [Volvox carteri f. nagariensis]|eukprot:XP_002948896.1 hypothetical protein VOLCADRAFT_89227 [Volvox carteri f. nagariensis]